jgi:hypothetical protein
VDSVASSVGCSLGVFFVELPTGSGT